jgi:hypothetical protein
MKMKRRVGLELTKDVECFSSPMRRSFFGLEEEDSESRGNECSSSSRFEVGESSGWCDGVHSSSTVDSLCSGTWRGGGVEE